MLNGGNVFAPASTGGDFGALNHGVIFAVCGDGDGCFVEDPFEGCGLVDQQVPRRRAHENFDTTNAACIHALDFLDVGCSRT